MFNFDNIHGIGEPSGDVKYANLPDKPQVNSVTLVGNKSLDDLGIQAKGDYALTADMNTELAKKADVFSTDKPITFINNKIAIKLDNQLLQVNGNDELTVNLNEIGAELTEKLNTSLSNITDEGREAINDIVEIPTATVSNLGLVKPDGSTILINSNGTISSVGGASESMYGVKGDYSTHYGILDCPNGLLDIVSGKTIRINSGIILQCAGSDSKTTIASESTQLLESTGDIVLFYAGGEFLECGDVFYQETEPTDGTSNYVAWYNPNTTTNPDKKWQFKSNDTGNVFRPAVATPLANIRLTDTNITRIDYIGYRILDDEIFALKSEIPTKTSDLINDSGFLTEIPDGYVTEAELSADLSTKANLSQLPLASSLMNGTAPTVADLTATEIEGLLIELNAILAQLRTRGVIA